MSLAERVWLIDRLETQANFGQAVHILEVRGDWVKVAVIGQPTPREPLGYPGWMPTVQLVTNVEFASLANNPFATVTSRTAKLFDDPQHSVEFTKLSFNARLPVLSQDACGVRVATPSGGTKWFRNDDVAVYQTTANIPRPSGEKVVAAASMFLGLHYLWGGVSGFGFDCSGLTSTMYSAHGIMIPRDAGPQYDTGVKVERDDLQTGDLVFFAHGKGTGAIHHVGIYAGDGEIIDTPTNTATVESGVERVKLLEHRYIDEYAGAVRYL